MCVYHSFFIHSAVSGHLRCFHVLAVKSGAVTNIAAAAAAKSLQSCPTLCDPMDCSPPGSSVRGILQARILEWVAMPSSRGSSQPRD